MQTASSGSAVSTACLTASPTSGIMLISDVISDDIIVPEFDKTLKKDIIMKTERPAYYDAYVSGDWKKVSIRSQSAPIFATTQTDAFVTITDLIT